MIRLVAEVLDKQVVDARGTKAGRVDGIVLELREGRRPLVKAIEISPITLLARFNRRLARWYARWDARLGPDRGTPFRVAWMSVDRGRRHLKLHEVVDDTPINALERWLRDRIVKRIPGSHR
ncbi:MAG TPA: hypothetical protein VGQ44_15260 [Gemmatimonadaceae bacterium]|jgi:sporulation protein YlmC with PRC-barrel domain|nr:hypothetical protein [Gemmatimonadaceae bacterium]